MSKAHARRSHDEEEHENHERWLVSYADMITVLMALFIVLFAISQVDQQKFLELKQGFAQGTGASSTIPVDGGAGLLDSSGGTPNPAEIDLSGLSAPADMSKPVDGGTTPTTEAEQAQQDLAAAQAELTRLEEVQAAMLAALTQQGLEGRVEFRVTERGLVAAIVSDDVFFASGSAELQPTGVRVLSTVTPVLQSVPDEIAVEGHANHLQISSAQYPSNWELSAARAAVVVRDLVTDGVDATRLSATGYGDTRPLYPVEDARALDGNRRVDLVLLSPQSPEVRALLPQLATAG